MEAERNERRENLENLEEDAKRNENLGRKENLEKDVDNHKARFACMIIFSIYIMASLVKVDPGTEAPKATGDQTDFEDQPKTEEELPVVETAAQKKTRQKREKKKRQAANKKKKREEEAAMETKVSAEGAKVSAEGAKVLSREADPLTVLLLSEQHDSNECSDVQTDRIIECIGRVLLFHGNNIIPAGEKKKLKKKKPRGRRSFWTGSD